MNEQIIITKEQALDSYGGNQAALARDLGISRSAVSQWPKEKPIPEAQALKLYYQLKPEVFQETSAA